MSPAAPGARRDHLLAGAWGLAEATLFFLVPDVLLSWIAFERPLRALAACLSALAGALAGGALLWAWAGSEPETVRAALEALPGVSPALFTDVHADLAERGLTALLLGPLRGVPYKLYAAAWGAQGGALAPLLLISVPARLLRFLAVTLLALVLRRTLCARLAPRAARAVHVLAWSAFYAWYFAVMAE